MAKLTDRLTDARARHAVPRGKPYTLADGGSLYLEVLPAGGKYWRLKYRFAGKQKRLALGPYPKVSLKEARQKRDEAAALLGRGIDPLLQRKATKEATADTFEAVAREWMARHLATKAPGHRDKVVRRLERDVFPHVGRRPAAPPATPPRRCGAA